MIFNFPCASRVFGLWGLLFLTACTQNNGVVSFAIHPIHEDSKFEAAAIADMNNDGKLDIFCGSYWYEAPEWRRHLVRQQQEINEYYNDFANLPLDVNGDGWMDIINSAFFSRSLFWLKNPGDPGQLFELVEIDRPGPMETAILFDINSDGRMDILPNVSDNPAWYEQHTNSGAPESIFWIKHTLPSQAAGHGIGAGDLNSDGRVDIVVRHGWLEQTGIEWQWHADFDLGDRPSIPILVHDVDEDDDADIIWGRAHDYGLFWLEQNPESTNLQWVQHLIDSSWSQPHFMLLRDLNNDGKVELLSGKRYRAHNGKDPGGSDPLCIYYYEFDPKRKIWHRNTVTEGNTIGFGICTDARDIDNDGDVDIVAPGKSGLYLLENMLQ